MAKLFQKATLHKNRQNRVSNFRIRNIHGCLLDWELCEDTSNMKCIKLVPQLIEQLNIHLIMLISKINDNVACIKIILLYYMHGICQYYKFTLHKFTTLIAVYDIYSWRYPQGIALQN